MKSLTRRGAFTAEKAVHLSRCLEKTSQFEAGSLLPTLSEVDALEVFNTLKCSGVK